MLTTHVMMMMVMITTMMMMIIIVLMGMMMMATTLGIGPIPILSVDVHKKISMMVLIPRATDEIL